MKYIRTFRGIHEVIKVKPMGNNVVFIPNEGFTKILKQADTIEELCDEFVVFDNNGKPQVYSPFDLKVWTTDNKLFGAIWTDKGLIYVAKMNDKGELELL